MWLPDFVANNPGFHLCSYSSWRQIGFDVRGVIAVKVPRKLKCTARGKIFSEEFSVCQFGVISLRHLPGPGAAKKLLKASGPTGKLKMKFPCEKRDWLKLTFPLEKCLFDNCFVAVISCSDRRTVGSFRSQKCNCSLQRQLNSGWWLDGRSCPQWIRREADSLNLSLLQPPCAQVLRNAVTNVGVRIKIQGVTAPPHFGILLFSKNFAEGLPL